MLYKAKHLRRKIQVNTKAKMLFVIAMLIVLAFEAISGIISYFSDYVHVVNQFTIAGTYTIHFDANGGTGTMPDQKVFDTQTVNLNLNTFTRTGFTHDGWNTSADGNGADYADGASVISLAQPGSTITLYAKWRSNDFNITYNLDGGTVEISNPTSYDENTETFTLNNPTKEGYTFKGWSGTGLTGDENLTVTIAKGSSGDRTYVANYIPNTYYIRFNSNGGTGTMNNQEMTYGTAATLTPNSFEKTDYSFTEWNTEPDGTGTGYDDEESVNNLTATDGEIIDLYAQWEDELYVAQIDNIKYETIYAAVAAVRTNNEQKTIKLLKNISIDSSIKVASGKNIVLNLQNHTINNTASTGIGTFENNGTLEITNGTLQSVARAGVINNNETGNLKLNNVTITATGSRQALYNYGGMAEITGNSQLSATTTERATVHNAKSEAGTAGTLIISGGTIVSLNATELPAVLNDETGTLIVTGGTIISANGNGIDNNSTLIIGNNDDVVYTNSPVIQGHTNGVTTTSAGTLEFYDGIVKGGTNAFNNDSYIDTIDSRSTLVHSSEQIDSNTYDTAYLDAPAKVSFEAEGGTPEFAYAYVEPGDPVGTLPTATRAHYSFDGWYTAAEGGTQITSETIVNDHTTYYAHWTQTEALVTFEAMGGTPAEQTMTVTIGNQLGSLPTATKYSSTLLGWFTTADETGTQISANTVITEDTIFYAHWDISTVEVIFDANEGSVTETERNVIPGSALETLPIPTRQNYYFAGWYTDPTNGTRVKEGTVITADTTLYAHWISNPVASIGPIYYEKLLAAMRDVPRDNTQTTIVLLKDTLEAVDVYSDQNIIIDLDGFTLYNNGTKMSESSVAGPRPSTIENYGTLTLINGTVNASSTQSTINNNGGTLNVENVTVTQTGSSSKQAIYNDSGTVTISGNSYISAKNSGKYGGADRGAIQNVSTSSETGTVIITGGTVVSTTSHAIVNQGRSVLILGEEDGTIDNTTPVIQGKTYGVQNMINGIFKFYDGTVKGKNGSISGTTTNTENGATKVDSTEVIGSETYQITYYE